MLVALAFDVRASWKTMHYTDPHWSLDVKGIAGSGEKWLKYNFNV